MNEKLEKAIVDIVGKDNLTHNIIDLVSYACDASEHCNRPLCAVFAENTAQIADLMKLANREISPSPPGCRNRALRHGGSHQGRHCFGSLPHEQNP